MSHERDVEVVMTHHAQRRIEERIPDFDVATFSPTELTRQGARLWLGQGGNGLLVLEESGSGWERLTVVTAIDSGMVYEGQRRGAGQHGFSKTARTCRTKSLVSKPRAWLNYREARRAELERAILAAVEAEPGLKVAHYAQVVGLPEAVAGAAMSGLKGAHRLRRIKGAHDWAVVPMLPVPGSGWVRG